MINVAKIVLDAYTAFCGGNPSTINKETINLSSVDSNILVKIESQIETELNIQSKKSEIDYSGEFTLKDLVDYYQHPGNFIYSPRN